MDLAEFRQRAMIAAMQGLLSSRPWDGPPINAKELAKVAAALADALVEANGESDGPNP